MEVSSMRSSIASNHSKDPTNLLHKSGFAPHGHHSGQKDALDSISEYTLNSTSNHTFHALHPDASCQSIQLTSSPRKPMSRCSGSKSTEFLQSISQHSLSNFERPSSRSSYQSGKSRSLNRSVNNDASVISHYGASQSFVNETQNSCFPSIGAANDTFTSQLLDDSGATNISARITPSASPQRVSLCFATNVKSNLRYT